MDVILSEDQKMLQETARRFLDNRSPIGAVRKMVGDESGLDRDIWRQGAELGWLSLFVPEDHGGIAESANGLVDAAIVAEELDAEARERARSHRLAGGEIRFHDLAEDFPRAAVENRKIGGGGW